MSEFDEYIIHGEPGQREKADAWQTAIGLQDVDGLKVSPYLLETARQHIEGYVTIDEAREMIHQYYRTPSKHDVVDEEGDKASANIAKIINEPSFAFSLVGLTSIHRRIFDGIFKFAGTIREVDITKKEWVLGGEASVSYHPAFDLKAALEHDLSKEKAFDYARLSIEKVIAHLARFISDLWQIHPFREGNTRTMAVFLIKYLHSMGIQASNEMFKQHSWYFRNALVRASYKGLNISPTTEFVELFLRNVILNENNELHNRSMLVSEFSPVKHSQSIKSAVSKYHFDTLKQTESCKSTSSKSQSDTLNCTLEEIAVLRLIKDNPRLTQTEMAESIKKSSATIKRITAALVEKGILVRKNGRRDGWWEIKA